VESGAGLDTRASFFLVSGMAHKQHHQSTFQFTLISNDGRKGPEDILLGGGRSENGPSGLVSEPDEWMTFHVLCCRSYFPLAHRSD
jgi:hypothetical protein